MPLNEEGKKREKFKKLYKSWKKCKRCDLCKERKNVVVGHGNIMSRFLIVGQNPGRNEDEEGKPFVGNSGKLLNKVLDVVGLNRDDFYITNSVACKSPGNREPTKGERKSCSKRLNRIINILDPTVIVCLGKIAIKSFFLYKDEYPISSCRGIYRRDKLPRVGRKRYLAITYHPSYLVRNPGNKKIWNEWKDDWMKIAEIILREKEKGE